MSDKKIEYLDLDIIYPCHNIIEDKDTFNSKIHLNVMKKRFTKKQCHLLILPDLNLNEKHVKSLAFLAKTFSHITHLYLRKSEITVIWKHTFQGMKNLEHINFENSNQLTKFHDGSLDDLPKLKNMRFIGSKYDDGRYVVLKMIHKSSMYIIQIYSQKPTYTTESWIFCHQLKFANLKEGFSSSHKWAFKKSAYKYWDQGTHIQVSFTDIQDLSIVCRSRREVF